MTMNATLNHICLADDDADDLLLFSMALKEIDGTAELTCFEHCSPMLGFLETTTTLPKVIILDVNMPGNNDLNCLIKIKTDAQTSHIPVFMWSTTVSETVRELAFKYGAKDYIIKPTSLADLKDIIKQILTAFNITSPSNDKE